MAVTSSRCVTSGRERPLSEPPSSVRKTGRCWGHSRCEDPLTVTRTKPSLCCGPPQGARPSPAPSGAAVTVPVSQKGCRALRLPKVSRCSQAWGQLRLHASPALRAQLQDATVPCGGPVTGLAHLAGTLDVVWPRRARGSPPEHRRRVQGQPGPGLSSDPWSPPSCHLLLRPGAAQAAWPHVLAPGLS